jgi:ABC-type nitrate/sulfonate/bicarbonate transport system ATPase subunit
MPLDVPGAALLLRRGAEHFGDDLEPLLGQAGDGGRAGLAIGLVGPTGSGKTTLLKAILGSATSSASRRRTSG